MRTAAIAAGTAAVLGLGLWGLLGPADAGPFLPPERPFARGDAPAVLRERPGVHSRSVVVAADPSEGPAQERERQAIARQETPRQETERPELPAPRVEADPALVSAGDAVHDEVITDLLNEEDPVTLQVLSDDLIANAGRISPGGVARLVTLARVGAPDQRAHAFTILAERPATPSLTESVYLAYADNPSATVLPHARAALQAWAAQGGDASRYLAALGR